MIHFN